MIMETGYDKGNRLSWSKGKCRQDKEYETDEALARNEKHEPKDSAPFIERKHMI
jgi:hypothetical protein